METDVVPSALEVPAESQVEVAPLQQSPKTAAAAVLRPGVLHLGKVGREACTEVEATRILVPHAAISRSTRAQAPAPAPGLGEQGPPESCKSAQDWKASLEKLQNSERRLLRDKEGLSNQLRVQTEVGWGKELCRFPPKISPLSSHRYRCGESHSMTLCLDSCMQIDPKVNF